MHIKNFVVDLYSFENVIYKRNLNLTPPPQHNISAFINITSPTDINVSSLKGLIKNNTFYTLKT